MNEPGSLDLLARMRDALHDSPGGDEGVRDVVALAIAGMAGSNWNLIGECARNHWRMAAAEIVEFIEQPVKAAP